MAIKLYISLGDREAGEAIQEAEIASFNLSGSDATAGRPKQTDEIVIGYTDPELYSTLSRHQRDGSYLKKVVIRRVDIGQNGSTRTLQTWEFLVVYVAATDTGPAAGELLYKSTLIFQSVYVQGTVVGLEDQQFEDPSPQLFAEHGVTEKAQPQLPRGDDEATAVILVCRNEWNTLNSHSTGFHWFSA